MKLKLAYTISELAQMTGFTRFQLYRLLDQAGLKNLRPGKKRLVYLSQLRKCASELFDSLTMLDRAQRPREQS
jgi:excisionase family DNA binding protein